MTIESTTTRPAASSLRGLCDGAIHLPGDPGYDEARVPWNVAIDQRPAAVAYPANAAEVVEVVRAATAAGLRVAPQSTGHNAGPLGDLSDVVVLRTSAMTGVSVDATAKTIRVEGGAMWMHAVEAAAAEGFAVLHGSSPDVGIAGYSLGGGIGWYARKLGMAANSLTAVELVTADGSVVRADRDTNAELFWALRGGGGNFGVVTALEFAMFDFSTAYAGMLMWDRKDAEPVLRRWATWAADAPDEVTTAFRILNLPPMPELPEFLRGRQLAVIDGAVLGDDETAEAILAPLRELGPEVDTFARMPVEALMRIHMDPEGPTPFTSDNAMIGELPDEAIDAFLSKVGDGTSSSLLLAELRQLGGALGRPDANAGALPILDGRFALFAGAVAATPEMGAQGHADANDLVAAMQPWTTGTRYLNLAESAVDAKAAFDAQNWEQLKAIRSVVDPDGVFVANHVVPRFYENGQPAV
jgi:FAD/FMN-containing dehydrogenase